MNYFPTRLAIGSAFCNREKEQKRLARNIKDTTPTLLMSPRRYGKTSLVFHILKKNKLPFAHIDLYKELNLNDIESAIFNGVGHLLSHVENTPKKLLQLGADFFANFHIKVGLEKVGLQLEVGHMQKKTKDTLVKVLEKLHAVAVKKNKKMIIFLDEFQIVSEITNDYSIEAAIREVAQKSTHIVYIFSGSNRHLLESMFFDKKRPFYNLCDVMHLDRIAEEHYEPHLNKIAKKIWKKPLDEQTLNAIFHVTKRHPYYMNRLCNLLLDEKLPSENKVYQTWNEYVFDNQSNVEASISELAVNQRRMLVLIANHEPVKQLYSSDMLKNSDMSSSSVSRVVKTLKQKDYLFVNEDGYYCILDPLVEAVLQI